MKWALMVLIILIINAFTALNNWVLPRPKCEETIIDSKSSITKKFNGLPQYNWVKPSLDTLVDLKGQKWIQKTYLWFGNIVEVKSLSREDYFHILMYGLSSVDDTIKVNGKRVYDSLKLRANASNMTRAKNHRAALLCFSDYYRSTAAPVEAVLFIYDNGNMIELGLRRESQDGIHINAGRYEVRFIDWFNEPSVMKIYSLTM